MSFFPLLFVGIFPSIITHVQRQLYPSMIYPGAKKTNHFRFKGFVGSGVLWLIAGV
jgi:hypothetical protein